MSRSGGGRAPTCTAVAIHSRPPEWAQGRASQGAPRPCISKALNRRLEGLTLSADTQGVGEDWGLWWSPRRWGPSSQASTCADTAQRRLEEVVMGLHSWEICRNKEGSSLAHSGSPVKATGSKAAGLHILPGRTGPHWEPGPHGACSVGPTSKKMWSRN